jgi:tetratricopeptide (TPR) repeat protein
MDLLDGLDGDLYFEQPLSLEVEQLLKQAADIYPEQPDQSEIFLTQAQTLAPTHLMVLVGLYRYFYYRHRYQDALAIGEQVLKIVGEKLGFSDWQILTIEKIEKNDKISMRFYLTALKGNAYLYLRLNQPDQAIQRLEKITTLDPQDRLGSKALLTVVRENSHV